ncbi:tRNA modification GTPase MnmE [Methyloligella halotolerans]|uniref:tRNA modification GTPase MnmE n=1 Tax=Methyloligella halotolerans TaxID=1177755 RepID=A0A1E2S0K4_9HYPH|nr:tRNA uridine-5-carboxymethylaminomethyl(34) synthesis GTPase MnmE [Methyloligella halotolerans]ODA68026.1 tRNA modification GTPase MnmE [Methyloligella halotolerans]
MKTTDTIIALASGQGRSAIALLRISGPATGDVVTALSGGLPEPRYAALRRLTDPATGSLLDRGLVLWFPAPASFTGEDMAELQIHGGRAVTANVVNASLTWPGVRLAEPGEFASRAFENGKLDLSAVEGLADLINAETAAQAKQALTQAEGSLRTHASDWRMRLLRAQALAEASIDFSDEDDVAGDAMAQAKGEAAALLEELTGELQKRSGERLRDGFRIVIAGPPNAGKSSLLNAIAARDVAIVSAEAGTTRDLVEVHLDLDGLPVILTDTAGLREGGGEIESEGMRRARSRAAEADLVIWLIDATDPQPDPPSDLEALSPLPVLNKIDQADGPGGSDAIAISAKSGTGLERLLDVLKDRAGEGLEAAGEPPAITRARHRTEIEAAASALGRFIEEDSAAELAAEELRVAGRHIGRLTGYIDVEEILGAIFGEFCIGK